MRLLPLYGKDFKPVMLKMKENGSASRLEPFSSRASALLNIEFYFAIEIFNGSETRYSFAACTCIAWFCSRGVTEDEGKNATSHVPRRRFRSFSYKTLWYGDVT